MPGTVKNLTKFLGTGLTKGKGAEMSKFLDRISERARAEKKP